MKRISLRLPDDLHTLVETAAKQDRRSLHGELLWLIEKGLTHENPSPGDACGGLPNSSPP